MFDPITLGISGALAGGSILANMFADKKRQQASDLADRNAFFTSLAFQNQANQIRADALARSNAINEQARNRYANFTGDMAAAGKDLGSYFSSAAQSGAPSPGVVAVPTIGGPDSPAVAAERAKQMGLAKAFTDQQGAALGNLRSFDTTMGTANRNVGRDAQLLERNLTQAGQALDQNLMAQRNVMNLLPQQMADAQNAGSGWGTVADLMRGGGKVALGYGMQQPGTGYFKGGSLFPALAPVSSLASLFGIR